MKEGQAALGQLANLEGQVVLVILDIQASLVEKVKLDPLERLVLWVARVTLALLVDKAELVEPGILATLEEWVILMFLHITATS